MRSLYTTLLVVAWLSACSGEADTGDSDAEILRSVKVETVGERPLSGMRRFVARIEPINTVALAFQTGGRIERMAVQEGSRIERGTLLAELEQVDYELALRDAEAGLELAREEHERNQRLAQRDAVSRAALQRSRAELERRRVAFDNAQRNLSLTRLEAPFDALVSRQLVDPFTQVQPGTAVLRLQDVSALQVSIGVPEDLMYTLDDTDRLEASLTLATWPGRSFPVHYHEHSTQPDPVAQTYELLFSLPQQDDITILPGMTGLVTVSVRDEAAVPGISVPVAALDTRRAPQMVVWVLDEGSVHPREVEAGTLGGDRIVIESGLAPGDTIVTAGAHLLQEGMTVTPSGRTASNQ
ncbi:MAG: efflux RND transporter periplasmic adaptor subunit [Pseudohongiellaceae bacterium]